MIYTTLPHDFIYDEGVNERIRSEVRKAMKEKGVRQSETADALGLRRVYINRMLRGETSTMPARWAQLLDFLGLELVVKAKNEEPKAS